MTAYTQLRAGQQVKGEADKLGILDGDNGDRYFITSERPARRTIIASGEAGKPSIVVMPNGELVLSYIRNYNVARNPPVGETMEVIRSSDGGKTWSEPVRAFRSPHNDREGYLIKLPDDTLLLGYMRVMAHVDPMHPWQGPYLSRSEDGGRTWSETWQVDVSAFCPAGPYGAADRGHVVMPDGRLFFFVGIYEFYRRPRDYMLVSYDGGRTFPEHYEVSASAGDSSFTLHPSGKLFGALRINGDDYPYPGANALLASRGEHVHFLGLVESSDEGKTWTKPIPLTNYNEIPGQIITLRDGRLLLSFGVRHLPLSIQAMISDPSGAQWQTDKRIQLAWTGERFYLPEEKRLRHAMGHPFTVQLPDDSMLTAYYRLSDASDGASCQVEAVFWDLPK